MFFFFASADPLDITSYVICNNEVILVNHSFKLLMIFFFVLEQSYNSKNKTVQMDSKWVYWKGENGKEDRCSVWCECGIALEEVFQLKQR